MPRKSRTEEPKPRPSGAPRASTPGLAAVAVCFFASGAASLILEVVWTRLLRLVFGSTTLAVSTVLVAYMLGLGLGGLFGARAAQRWREGVRRYGWIEIGIGLYALIVPFLLAALPAANFALTGALSFWPAAVCRFLLALAVLLLPTILMGATLPMLVEAMVRQESDIARRVGLLYGLNTLGAVAGVLLATFVLFPAVGVRQTNLIAALLGIAVGVVALRLLAPHLAGARAVAAPAPESAAPRAVALSHPALLAYGIVGFTSLTYEVCWTRALSMILGSSVYAFASMLAAFLTGIALGSLVARRWFDRLQRPLMAYGLGLGLLGVLALGTLVAFRALPSLFVGMVLRLGTSPAAMSAAYVGVSAVAMLGPTLVLGALFPLLVRVLAARSEDAPGAVGAAYFLNTIGSATGAFAAGFVLIPTLGLQRTVGAAVALNLLAAAALLLWQREWRGWAARGSVAAALVAAGLVIAFPPGWSPQELVRGVYLSPQRILDVGLEPEPLLGVPRNGILFYREGINTTVSVHRENEHVSLRVNGKTDASNIIDLNTQVLLGQVPTSFGGRPERVLAIGLASGTTVGSVALHDPQALDVVELEPAMIEASRYFDEYNHRPLARPGVRVLVDDGRNVLAYTRDSYDVIISEPSNPWITGASNLFTREFFAAAHGALRPGGQLMQWVQLYALPAAGLRSILASLQEQFRYVYGFSRGSGASDLLLLARDTPLTAADLPRWENLAPAVRDDLVRVGLFSTEDLWTLLRLSPAATQRLASGAAAPNTDDNMFVEILTPWALYGRGVGDVGGALDEAEDGVLPVLAQAGVRLEPEQLGALALSAVATQGNRREASAILGAAGEGGAGAGGAVAAALLEAGTDPALLRTRLDAIVKAHPSAFAPRWQRAEVLDALLEHQAALEDAEVALQARPGDPRVRFQRIRALNELERYTEARSDAEALSSSPFAVTEPQVRLEAAITAAGVGDLPTAIRLARAYVERLPAEPSGWYALSEYYRLAGNAEQSRVAAENQKRALRNLAVERHANALRAERAGALEEAKTLLRAALDLVPDDKAAEADLRRLERKF